MGWFSTLFGGMGKAYQAQDECEEKQSDLESQGRSGTDRKLLHVARQILDELDGIHETILDVALSDDSDRITKKDLVELESRLLGKIDKMLSDRSMLGKLASGLEKSTDTLEKTVAANQPAGDPGARAGS